MATEIKVWEVVNDTLHEIESDDFAADNLEKDLETWITKNPSILGGRLLPIKEQHEVPNVGILDLLCIDDSGKLVVIEFKRALTSRETVAQALDYASWLDSTTEVEIRNLAQESLGKSLEDAFLEQFSSDLQSFAPQNHRILVVAPKLDSSAERIINYLSDRYGMDLNAVFFRYAKTSGGQKILVRTVLVPDRNLGKTTDQFTVPQLLAMANERKTSQLLEACRKVSPVLWEEPTGAYKGSFRYWMSSGDKWKMVFGVNVSGARDKATAGELHVWIPPKSIAELSGIPESDIRDRLKTQYAAQEAGSIDVLIRMQSVDQAKSLVTDLCGWANAAKSENAKAATSV